MMLGEVIIMMLGVMLLLVHCVYTVSVCPSDNTLSYFLYSYLYFYSYLYLYPTTRIPNSSLYCSSSSQKTSSADISETESSIIDLLVSKRPQQILNKKIKRRRKNNNQNQNLSKKI